MVSADEELPPPGAELSEKLARLEAKRESLEIELMRASTPEELEYVKSEMMQVDLEIEELERRRREEEGQRRPS